jgi:hypothetical protein
MPDLASEPVGTAMEPAGKDDAGRHAGSDRQIGEVIDIADDTPAMKADRSRTHVVLDDAWSTEPRLHLGAERKARPAEVDGETDAARQRIDPSRHADADGRDVVRRGSGRLEGAVDD